MSQTDGKDDRMTNDFTIFWRNNERASALFYDLLARSERGTYDDDFLVQLAAYREAAPESERADIFAAQYLLHHGDAETATLCAERAYTKRPVNYEVWKLLAKIYTQLGRTSEALTMAGYAYGLYLSPELSVQLNAEQQREDLGRLSIALGLGNFAPLIKARASLDETGLRFQSDVFIGEPMPLTMPVGRSRFWTACYTDTPFLSDRAALIEEIRYEKVFREKLHRDFFFQLQQAEEVRGAVEISVPVGTEVILPVAGTEHLQELTVKTETMPAQTAYLGKWAFSNFRLMETTQLTAVGDAPYAVGTPIRLGHNPARRKLVLNILIDGLSWNVARTRFPDCMPNIARFFAHGTIFDEHFSTSECTYPALPVIETGRYPHHTQVFNERDSHEIPLDFKTLSECMSNLGYYAVSPMGANDNIYCGAMRGYDLMNVTSWIQSSPMGVDRTIMQLEAFAETDQFLYLHLSDVHPWNAKGFKFYPAVETQLPLSARLFDIDESLASVRLPQLTIYQEQLWKSLRHVDLTLGYLFSYIEEHFREDEYIVNLYSDHGNSVFTTPTGGVIDIIGENSTSSVWMMRGAGVPKGIVANELTSIADIYPTLGHLCGFPVPSDIDGNLPAVFGGKERNTVCSMSLFPGQTYKLAVRTHEHALRLETREPVDEDGTVDFAGAAVGIYPRGHELEESYEIDSPDLRAFFYPRARNFVREIANNGEFWPEMRAARPEWFGSAEK